MDQLMAVEGTKQIRKSGPFSPLTQREIDARDAGWHHNSNSTNALMARVLAGSPAAPNR